MVLSKGSIGYLDVSSLRSRSLV